MSSTLYKEELLSLGKTINSIGHWIQLFVVNYENRIRVYERNMSESFKTIPKSLPTKNW